MSASDDVFAGLFRVRSEALDCEGRVRTLCANGANRPVSGRILDQKAVRAGQIRSLPLYFYRFKRSAYNEPPTTAHARGTLPDAVWASGGAEGGV